MAEPEERSLDDFFAKRDKKKGKKEKGGGGGGGVGTKGAARPPDGTPAPSSSSFATSSLSGGGKSMKKERSGRNDGQDSHQDKTRPERRAEDEWKEFEQKEVDYSGLRLQSLQIGNEKEDDDNDRKEEHGGEWEDAGGYGTEKISGPWNKTATAQAPVNIVAEAPEPVQSSGVYRPPAARASATTRKPQGPPEIFSDTQFPSLQSTAKHIESRRIGPGSSELNSVPI
ncbi:hypothetical protein FKM82_006896 [Ascaphus truei]